MKTDKPATRYNHWFECLPEAGDPTAMSHYRAMVCEVEYAENALRFAQARLDDAHDDLVRIARGMWTEEEIAAAKREFRRWEIASRRNDL